MKKSREVQCKRDNNTESGFSLIEVLVAMTIFLFIIGGIIMFSVNSIKASSKSESMQEAMDNARYALDDLAKKIRTSSNLELTGNNELFFIDNKTLVKYCYKFDAGQMRVAGFEPTIGAGGVMTPQDVAIYNAINSCNDLTNFESVVGGSTGDITINGKFKVLQTDIFDDVNPHRGFVQINIDIVYDSGDSIENKAEVHLQSGVSVVDYGREENLELDTNVVSANP